MVLILSLVACSDTEDKTQPLDELFDSATKQSASPEIDGAEEVIGLADSVCCPVMINLMDPDKKQQEWLAMEAETYCESYGIAYIRPDYQIFPDKLFADTVNYQCDNGKSCKLNLRAVADNYVNGMVFWRPDSVPLFVPASEKDTVFNSSAAEIYYRFTYQNSDAEKDSITLAEYTERYHDMIPEIQEKYHFGESARKMRQRSIDYKAEGGINNVLVAKIYFSFKYLLQKEKIELIAYNLIHYPLAYTEGGEKVPVNSPEDFIKLSDRILSDDFRQNFLRTNHYRLLGVDNRIMVGDNLMFFSRIGGDVKIVEINN